MTIRPCTEQDSAEVLRLLRQLWPDEGPNDEALLETYRNILKEATSCAFCAETDSGALAGFGTSTVYRHNLYYHGGVGYVTALVVDQNTRGGGIGRGLMQAMEAFAKQLGAKAMELDSSFHRTAAHDFYERIGYSKRAYAFSKML